MANRSYLYSYHPGEEGQQYRELAEWNYRIPIAHLLLVGSNPTLCSSEIWDIDVPTAIKGDAAEAHSLFLRFLEWLEPQLPADFAEGATEARNMLTRPDRQGSQFHLEPGEIYQLSAASSAEMGRDAVASAALAGELFSEVRRLLENPSATLDSITHPSLRDLRKNWEQELGMFFDEVLYYSLDR